MNRVFRFFGILTSALMLGVFALTASAATKSITLTVPDGPLSAGSQSIQVSVNNTGNSNANSFEIDWIPNANFTVVSGQVGGDPLVYPINPGIYGASYRGLLFLKQVPNKTSVAVTLNVVVTSSCGPTSVSWKGAAWTGAPGPLSQAFPLNGGPYSTSIAASGTCTLGFYPQPKGATINTTITSVGSDPTGAPVGVAVYNGADIDTSFTGTISLAIKLGTGTSGATLTGGGATNATNGVATFPNLSINKVGSDYRLTASGASTSVDSDMFSIFANGDIGCQGGETGYNNYNSSLGNTNHVYDPDAGNTPAGQGWGLRRGGNKITQGCVLVAYTFIAPSSGNNNVGSLEFDKTTGQKPSFKYLVTFVSQAVDSSNPTKGWTTFRPTVSWGVPDPVKGSPDFIPALFCIDDPGRLDQRNPTELEALLPTIPDDCSSTDPTPPNGPFCKASLAHPTVYVIGGKAKMCLSQVGQSTGAGNQLFPWAEVVDLEDSRVAGP